MKTGGMETRDNLGMAAGCVDFERPSGATALGSQERSEVLDLF
jgi:hypothetical protein